MADDFRVGVIAGVAQVAAAVVALVGTLATAGGDPSGSSSTRDSSSTSASPSAAAAPTTVPCTTVVERYRTLVDLDPNMIATLTTPGPAGLSPVSADPDARRCGLSVDAVRAMR